MNNIQAGADMMAGNGGYSEGTLEDLNKFAKARNQSKVLALAEQAGLYDETTPEEVPGFTACFQKFAELIIEECMAVCDDTQREYTKYRKTAFDPDEKEIYAEGEAASSTIKYKIKRTFGV